MTTAPPLSIRGALALEVDPSTSPARHALAQADAGALGAAIARDLARFDADVAQLELVLVGAHYDPVELLRPGWPLHVELDSLAARAPGRRFDPGAAAGSGGAGRIVAFGSHDARLPGALTPSPDFTGGPLRLVPWLLSGDAAVIARVGDALERDLMERGMAAADTALLAQEAFGLRIEHVRLLTLHDLCALTAMQYDHAGLGPLWPVLETALLSPDRDAWLDTLPEPLVHYADREARIAMLTPDAWRLRDASGGADGDEGRDTDDDHRLQRGFEHFEARQRQFAAVLSAHGVPVTFAHCSGDPRGEL